MASTVTITIGPPGSGKSYFMVRQLVNEILPRARGIVYTNLPIDVESIAERVSQAGKLTYDQVCDRLVVIPREVIETWMPVDEEESNGKDVLAKSGPWEYFGSSGRVTSEAVLVLDECDAFLGPDASLKTKRRWTKWCSEMRHQGLRCEFLVQHWDNVFGRLINLIEVRRYVLKQDMSRDPLFKILLGDWYELRAKFITGDYMCRVFVTDERKVSAKKWEKSDVVTYMLDKEYFSLYDSYNDPIKSGGKGVGGHQYEFQVRSHLGLLRWFIGRNLFRVSSRLSVVAFCWWLMFGGGAMHAMHMFQDTIKMGMKSNHVGERGNAQSVSQHTNGGVGSSGIASAAVRESGSFSPGTVVSGAGSPVVRPSVDGLAVHTVPDEYKAPITKDFLKVDPATDAPIAVMRSEVADMFGKVDEQQEEIEKLKAEIARANAAVFLAVLTPKRAVFSDGEQYAAGERIRAGEYKGVIINAIDYPRRRVFLSNGEYLRVGMPGRSESQGAIGAGLSNAVRSVATGK